MSTIIHCTSCQSRLTFPENLAGSDVRCPRCQAVFRMPAAGAVEEFTPRPTAPPAALRGPDDFRDLDETLPMDRSQLPEELPGKLRSALATIGLGCTILASLVVVIVAGVILSIDDPFPDAAYFPGPGTVRRVDFLDVLDLAGIVATVVKLAALVLLLVWFYNAHSNLRHLGVRRLEYTPGWAVGYFFVPILCFFRPYQVAQEIFRASSPEVPLQRPTAWRLTSCSPVIGWWWGLTLLEALLGGCGGMSQPLNSRQALLDPQLRSAIGMSLLSMAVALLGMLMIRQVRRRQLQRFAKIVHAGSPDASE